CAPKQPSTLKIHGAHGAPYDLMQIKTSLNRGRHARITHCIFNHPSFTPKTQCLTSIPRRLVRNAG
ncbi:MAG: hypothetical protein WBP02_13200, partial [Gammaproteobacteria bacterium]